jgi:choice-of-anchor A domain-containing protein
MKIKSLCTLGLFLAASGSADCIVDPHSYLVFSLNSIQAVSGDFQGLTGAVGSIDVTDFAFQNQNSNICANVVSGGSLRVFRGGSDGGNVESGQNVCIDLGHVYRGEVVTGTRASCGDEEEFSCSNMDGSDCSIKNRKISPNVAVLENVANSYVQKSIACELAPNQISPTPGNTLGTSGELLFEHSSCNPVQVFHVSKAQMTAATGMHFHGNGLGAELFVVNIDGDSVNLDNLEFELDGVDAGQIILNFPSAKSVVIAHTPFNNDLGLAATVLAPNAKLNLTAAKITGGVYVGDIQAVHGQVNFAASNLEQVCN